MKIFSYPLIYPTSAGTDIIDEVAEKVREAGISEGQALISVPGSTASVTTIEYEGGVVRDLVDALERIATAAATLCLMMAKARKAHACRHEPPCTVAEIIFPWPHLCRQFGRRPHIQPSHCRPTGWSRGCRRSLRRQHKAWESVCPKCR